MVVTEARRPLALCLGGNGLEVLSSLSSTPVEASVVVKEALMLDLILDTKLGLSPLGLNSLFLGDSELTSS